MLVVCLSHDSSAHVVVHVCLCGAEEDLGLVSCVIGGFATRVSGGFTCSQLWRGKSCFDWSQYLFWDFIEGKRAESG